MKRINQQEICDMGRKLGEKLKGLKINRPVTLMEVCGTHTHSLFRSGIRHLAPPEINLLSGPGCPVCVTPAGYVDCAVELVGYKDVIITTFGDMIRVPGSKGSLQRAMANESNQADVRVVYSPLDALTTARENPHKKVVFLAVGFETTAPTVAATVMRATTLGVDNITFLTAHKTVPPALRALLADPQLSLDGFILPGHVCAVTGWNVFNFVPEEYGVPAVVAGFESVEMLGAILTLTPRANAREAVLVNMYRGHVQAQGNPKALALMEKVFTVTDSIWRGIGNIPDSGLVLRPEFANFDTRVVFGLDEKPVDDEKGCRCGDILKGKIFPPLCPLFGKACTPEKPVGPCMVSSEGTCSAYYKYGF